MYIDGMRKSFNLIRDVVFFAGFFLYVWKGIRPELYCQFNEPVFSFDSRYLSEFFHYPAGILQLVSDFFSQFYLLPWLGAVIITGIAAGITVTTRKISDSIFKSRSTHLFPAVFLLVLHNQFFHNLTVDIGILLVLLFFRLQLGMSPRNRQFRIAVFLSSSLCIYWSAGGYLMLFASLCGLHEILIRRRPMNALLYAGVAAFLPYIAATALSWVDMKKAYGSPLPFDIGYKPAVMPYLLVLYYPAMMLTPAIVRIFEAMVRRATSGLRFVLQAGFLFGSGILLALTTADRGIQTMLRIDCCARSGRYEEVIRLARRKSSDHLLAAFHTNRALFHTGRLLDDMFSFPQKWWVNGLILSSKEAYEMPLRNSDVWLDLGHVNEAQHWAHEALATAGNTPWNCQRLAEIYILKGNPAAAEKCLLLLDKTLFFRGWAKRNRKFNDMNPPAETGGRFAEIRSRMVAEDFIVHTDFPERDLEYIVDQNPANQMAFEYLIAHYLLMGLPDRLADRIGNLKFLHYTRLPRHFEEALLLHQVLNKMKPAGPGAYPFSRGTVLRFRDFQAALKRCQGRQDSGRSELKRPFGDTYWYYYLFENPMKRQRGKTGIQPREE